MEYTTPPLLLTTRQHFLRTKHAHVPQLVSGILKGSPIVISTFKEPLIYLGNDKQKGRKLIRGFLLSSQCVVQILTAIGI